MNDPITRQMYQSCRLCPRMCGIDRSRGTGFCGCSDTLRAARAALHQWEEPCLSGAEGQPGGSGTVFFSGCTLRCLFCQNYRISSENFGKELTPDQLASVFLDLQSQGRAQSQSCHRHPVPAGYSRSPGPGQGPPAYPRCLQLRRLRVSGDGQSAGALRGYLAPRLQIL